MHPADEVEAFSKLLASGKSAADIAARFGVSEAVVLKRLALARVSPLLLQQYREGVLTLEILQAFTLTDDQTFQEHVWNQLHSWDRNAQAVRRLLSRDDIAATDKPVRFVGLANYEAHGGTLRRDLFADDEQGVYIQDAVLLNRLVSEKLADLASVLQADGWKWVEIQPEQNHQFAARLRRLPAQWEPLSPKRQARLDTLQAEQAELEAQLSANDSEEADEDDPRYIRLNQLDSAIAHIEDKRKEVYPAETKALSGVVVAVDWNGNAHYTYGLLKREDEVALAQPSHETAIPTTSSAIEPATDETEEAYSAPLVEKLTQYKTAAIAAELMQQPKIALAALVHALVLSGFGLDLQLYRSETSIQISTTEPHLEAAETGPAFTVLQEQRQAWLAQFPKTSDELWHWCLEQTQDTLLRLLAFCAAKALNAVQTKGESPKHQRLQHANALATALNVDIGNWFQPTVDNFFGHVTKAQILNAVTEAGHQAAPDSAKLKKADLAEFAERQIQASGWLPEPVRINPGVRKND